MKEDLCGVYCKVWCMMWGLVCGVGMVSCKCGICCGVMLVSLGWLSQDLCVC